MRPGTTVSAMPVSAASTGTPTASSSATARTALATLKAPGSRNRAGQLRPPGPCRVKADPPSAAGATSVAGGGEGRPAGGGGGEVGGPPVGVRAGARDGDRAGPDQPTAVGVVDVDDLDGGAAVEEQRLGLEVLLQRAVEVEVVLAEVG